MEPMSTNVTFSAPVIGAAVAFIIWVLTRIIEFIQNRKKEISAKERYIAAIYAEIEFNTIDMRNFLKEKEEISAAKTKIKIDLDYIPHITDARHTEIYESNLENINFIGKDEINKIVEFYGNLGKLKGQANGVYLPSYKTISVKGRIAVLDEIVQTARRCEVLGESILDTLEMEYATFVPKRKPHTVEYSVLSNKELKKEAEKLSLNLNRVNASHGRSPVSSLPVK